MSSSCSNVELLTDTAPAADRGLQRWRTAVVALVSLALLPIAGAQGIKGTDAVPPVIIEGPIAAGMTRDSALVTWKTQVPASGTVFYGVAADALTEQVDTSSNDSVQQVALMGLQPATEYFARVEPMSPEGVPGPTRLLQFTTPAARDTAPPVFVALPSVAAVSDTAVLLTWSTDEFAFAEILVSDALGVAQVISEDVAAATQTLLIEDLLPASAHTLAITVIDTSGNRVSVDLAVTTRANPDTTPPEIVEGVLIEAVTGTTVHLRWHTSIPATSVVNFGEGQSLTMTQALPGLRREHHVVVAGLTPGRSYGIQAASVGWQGNGTVMHAPFSLTTLPAEDTAPPALIAAPTVIAVTDTTATVYWETNEPSTTAVEFQGGTGPARRVVESLNVVRHQATLTGLLPNTRYTYSVESVNVLGNSTIQDESSSGELLAFSTESEADTAPPEIVEGPEILAIMSDGFTVRWVTDEPSDSFVRVRGARTGDDHEVQDGRNVLEHIVTLRGLDAATEYQVEVSSADIAQNAPAVGAPITATTATTADITGPEFIGEIAADAVGETTAELHFETGELASADIAVGLSPGTYEIIQATTGLNTHHVVTLAGLSRGTRYSYIIRAIDQNQNVTLSEPGEFTTSGDILGSLPGRLLMEVGERQVLTPPPANPGDDPFTFASSNPSVATVSNTGTVTAVGVGRTIIQVTSTTSQAIRTVTVDVIAAESGIDTRDIHGFFGLLGILLLQNGESGIIGPCFIATAAAGTPLATEIDVLRQFRDEWLLTNGAGTMFVDVYYHLSPPVADVVAQNPVLGAVVRVLLIPVLILAGLLMYQPALLGVLFVAAVCLGLRRRRYRQRV